MAGSFLLLGSTDLTRSIAARARSAGLPLGGVVSPPREFRISYSPEPVHNSRYADMSAWCREHDIAFQRYDRTGDLECAALRTGSVLAVAAGWYHMVPSRIRRLFPQGCAGVHASLLPRYRGGAPLNWALLNGDSESGVSLFALGDGVDDGPLYDQRRFSIGAADYIADVVERAERLALNMVCDAVPRLLEGTLQPSPQQGEPSYALQRRPSDGIIDWRHAAAAIARLVRSTSRPYPGAMATLDGQCLTIWRARPAEGAPHVYGACGQIVRLPGFSVPAVVCGSGLLLIEEVEGPGNFDVAVLERCHQRRFDVHPRIGEHIPIA